MLQEFEFWRKVGNVDAAVRVSAALCVTEPPSTGIWRLFCVVLLKKTQRKCMGSMDGESPSIRPLIGSQERISPQAG